MNDFTTSDRDVSRAIRSWLHEDRHEDASRVAGAVLDHVEATPRRRAAWPARRTPLMNKIVAIGLGAAAVVALVIVGAQLIASPNTGVGGPTPPDSAASPGAESLEEYVLVEGGDGQVEIAVTTAAPHWSREPDGGALCWGDVAVCAGPPDGAGIFAFEGREYHVYSDACHSPGPGQDTFATTVEELVDALRSQVHRAGSLVSTDIVLDGHAGRKIDLYSLPSPGDCDFTEDRIAFGLFRVPGSDEALYSEDWRKEEVWAVDVNGLIVVLVAAYHPDTPASVVEELRAMAESATFEGP